MDKDTTAISTRLNLPNWK